jgi:hypothetical protein
VKIHQPPIRLSGGSPDLEALTDEELDRRIDTASRALQRLRDEQDRRRRDTQLPTIYSGGDPDLRATFG